MKDSGTNYGRHRRIEFLDERQASNYGSGSAAIKSLAGYAEHGRIWRAAREGGRAIYGSGSTWAADHFPHSRLLLGGITTWGRRGPSLNLLLLPFIPSFPFPPSSLLLPSLDLLLLLLLPPLLWSEEGRWEGMDINGKINHFCAHFICSRRPRRVHQHLSWSLPPCTILLHLSTWYLGNVIQIQKKIQIQIFVFDLNRNHIQLQTKLSWPLAEQGLSPHSSSLTKQHKLLWQPVSTIVKQIFLQTSLKFSISSDFIRSGPSLQLWL